MSRRLGGVVAPATLLIVNKAQFEAKGYPFGSKKGSHGG